MVTGSSVCSRRQLNDTKFGLYEPSGGSAFSGHCRKGNCESDRTILSAAMMLRYSFDLDREAGAMEQAVNQSGKGWLPDDRHHAAGEQQEKP